MIIGLDLGKRTTGIAISNGQLATPYATITHRSIKEEVEKITKVVNQLEEQESNTHPLQGSSPQGRTITDEKGITTVVIGYVEGQIKSYFEKFAQKLSAKRGDLKVVLHDETLTTRQAMENMIKLGVAKTKRRQKEHQVAAAIILQSYLDSI